MPARHMALLMAGPIFLLGRILWGVWTHPVPPVSQWLMTLTILLLLTLFCCTYARSRKSPR
ncbi:hypothetical protein [Salmonirosea aquatica]|uniref:Uncharacterized protein n=1 Tax=Salmonirosea aquatica TaxID=2654236 RepID=A0A7C9FFE7_9BACT|nr:hypothetical protein [Cytophagaceae bacterium SJW1-29]